VGFGWTWLEAKKIMEERRILLPPVNGNLEGAKKRQRG
jgi:hypothetical protein